MSWRRTDTSQALPSISPGLRVYAIGDIHGRLDLLDAILDAIDTDLRNRPHDRVKLVFLGDYVDRGAQSAGVIYRLIEVMQSYDAVCLMGNHELMFATFLDQPHTLDQWLSTGAAATLSSYGITPPSHPTAAQAEALCDTLRRAMPLAHRVFLSNRPLTSVCGDYLFVHAGIRHGLPLSRQGEADLVWIRHDFTNSDEPFEKFVVHGHTPVPTPEVRPNRINIDTGAFATGRLSCLVLEGDGRWLLQT
jgi:serine/threonine protein phosphatase 1